MYISRGSSFKSKGQRRPAHGPTIFGPQQPLNLHSWPLYPSLAPCQPHGALLILECARYTGTLALTIPSVWSQSPGCLQAHFLHFLSHMSPHQQGPPWSSYKKLCVPTPNSPCPLYPAFSFILWTTLSLLRCELLDGRTSAADIVRCRIPVCRNSLCLLQGLGYLLSEFILVLSPLSWTCY